MWVTNTVKPDVSVSVIILALITGYCLLLTAGMLHHKRKQIKLERSGIVEGENYQPTISIVVPAHNEATVIAHTVKGLMNLDYPHYDVLIMDDRSEDGTGNVLANLAPHYVNHPVSFRYHIRSSEATPGKAAVLNEAMTMTTGEVIAVFDADAYVPRDFLKKMVPFLADRRTGGVQARKIIANAPHNFLTKCQDYEYALDAHFQQGRDSVRGAAEFRGNGQLVKRLALEDVGYWNEKTITDDLDLSTKFHLGGWDIRFAHKVAVYEEGITEVMPLFRQRIRWAEGTFARYVEYGGRILTSKRASWRSRADMIAYFVESFFPLWLVSDYAVVLLNVFIGEVTRPHLIGSLVAAPLMGLFFTVSLFVAILRFYKVSVFSALWGAIQTAIYICLLWTPVVVTNCWKVILKNKGDKLTWYKTPHFGVPGPPEPNHPIDSPPSNIPTTEAPTSHV